MVTSCKGKTAKSVPAAQNRTQSWRDSKKRKTDAFKTFQSGILQQPAVQLLLKSSRRSDPQFLTVERVHQRQREMQQA